VTCPVSVSCGPAPPGEDGSSVSLAGAIAHDFNNLLTVIRGRRARTREHQAPDPDRFDVDGSSARRSRGEPRRLLAWRRQAAHSEQLDLADVVTTASRCSQAVGEGVEIRPRRRHPRHRCSPTAASSSGAPQPCGEFARRDARRRADTIDVGRSRSATTSSRRIRSPRRTSRRARGLRHGRRDGCGDEGALVREPFFTTKEPGRYGLGSRACTGS
jgi:hypothetical protein